MSLFLPIVNKSSHAIVVFLLRNNPKFGISTACHAGASAEMLGHDCVAALKVSVDGDHAAAPLDSRVSVSALHSGCRSDACPTHRPSRSFSSATATRTGGGSNSCKVIFRWP